MQKNAAEVDQSQMGI